MFSGHPDKVRTLPSFARVNSYYFVGKKLKLYYLPNWEWLFGFIPETPGAPPGVATLALLALGISMALAILYFRTGVI